jgi:DNA-binding response OmpR family regulator
MAIRATIVVVDDSEEIRDTLQLILEREGYRVLPCAEADEAFAVIQRERPDVVITDIVLGVESGLDLITRIRSDLASPPPIIACSGFPGFAEEAERRGVAVFLPKPFELEALRDAVGAAFTHSPIAPEVVERASIGARRLRAKAVEAAHAALERLEARRGEFDTRTEQGLRFVTGYLGIGEAMFVLVQEGHLISLARSDGRVFRQDERVDDRLPLCRDIIETGSAIVIPDMTSTPGPLRIGAGTLPVRFFAGVPLYSDRVAIGAIVITDDQPRRISAEDLAFLEALGRRVSAVLSDDESAGPPPLWELSGLLSRSGFALLMDLEVKRAERRESWLQVLAFSSTHPETASEWSEELARVVSPKRVLLGEVGGGQFALLISRDDERTSEQALSASVACLRSIAGLHSGGLISVDAAGLPVLHADDILTVARALLARERRLGRGGIVRIAVRLERWRERAADQLSV